MTDLEQMKALAQDAIDYAKRERATLPPGVRSRLLALGQGVLAALETPPHKFHTYASENADAYRAYDHAYKHGIEAVHSAMAKAMLGDRGEQE